MDTITNYRQPWGLITPLGDPINRSLAKRMKWITSCASVSSFDLVVFDDWKINLFRVFIRVRAVREYFQVWWTSDKASVFEPHPEIPKTIYDVPWWNWRSVGFGFETIKVIPNPDFPWNYTLKEVPIYHCYYLGRYPWHWDYQNYRPIPPAGGGLPGKSQRK